MAIKQCRECGSEVSSEAKVCPKCGISKPIKKTSLIVKILLGIFGISILGNIIGGFGENSASTKSDAVVKSAERKIDPKEEALNQVTIEKLEWYKGGFDSIMMLNARIKNDGNRDIKDIEIECSHASNSGTRIDANRKIVYEVIKSGKSINIKDFNMGFIHSQATSTNCKIKDLVVI